MNRYRDAKVWRFRWWPVWLTAIVCGRYGCTCNQFVANFGNFGYRASASIEPVAISYAGGYAEYFAVSFKGLLK